MRFIFVGLALLLCAVLAVAAPTHDATSASASLDDSTDTIQHVLGSGSARRVICGVTYEDNTGTLTAPTFNGTTMNLAGSVAQQGTNYVGVYYLLEASLPAAGTYDVVAGSSGDQAGSGAIGVSCESSSNSLQAEPDIYAATVESLSSISDTVPSAAVGDILVKWTSAGILGRTHTHGEGTWTEFMDQQLGGTQDSSQSAARFTVTDQGTQTVTTTWSNGVNRGVQVVAHVEEAFQEPDTGTTIAMEVCPSSGSFTPPAYRAPRCGPSGAKSCCPPIITGGDGGPLGSTTIEGFFDSTADWGTGYVAIVPDGSSAPTCSDIVNCTGDCVDNDSATVNSSSRRASFSSITGTASTAYDLYGCHPNGRDDNAMVVKLADFETNAAPGGGGGSGGNLAGQGKFVSPSGGDGGNTTEGAGNDSNDGTAMTSAWASLSNIEATVTSEDAYGAEGGVWSGSEDVSITAGGSDADPKIIGAYYDEGNDNGDPQWLVDFSAHVRPKIDGPFEADNGPGQDCWQTDQCSLVGGSGWGGLIEAPGSSSSRLQWIEFNGWEVSEAAEMGVRTDYCDNCTVENFVVDATARASILLQGGNNPIIRNVEASRGGLCTDRPHSTWYTACGKNPPGTVVIAERPSLGTSGGLVENVYSRQQMGEGIIIGIANSIGRALRVADAFSTSGLYIISCEECVVERSIMGGADASQGSDMLRGADYGGGLSISVECFGSNCNQSRPGKNVLVRNTLLAGQNGECLQISVQSGTQSSITPDENVSLKMYGVTCAYPNLSMDSWNTDKVEYLDIQNSLFYGSNATCDSGIGAITNVTSKFNGFQTQPSVTNCRNSEGGFYGDPDFADDTALAENWIYGLSGTPIDNVVTDGTAATPQAGSPAIDAGNSDLLTTQCLLVENYPSFDDIEYDPPTASDWEKCLPPSEDLDGNARSGVPDIGAVES